MSDLLPGPIEAMRLVSELNDSFQAQGIKLGKGQNFEPFRFESDGDEYLIHFFGACLFTTEEDERGDGESLRDFVVAQANSFLTDIAGILL